MDEEVRILIAEDSATQALRLELLLKKHGFCVGTARDGVEAFALAGTFKPDLLIADIRMPRMDGYELCRRVKGNEELKNTPVVLLTSLSDPNDVLGGLRCGADNFMTKPYKETFLLSRIRSILVNRELRREHPSSFGIEIYFSGERHTVDSDRMQIVDLLFSSFETAVEKNKELKETVRELERTRDALEREKERVELAGAPVLVVDDNAAGRRILAEMLSGWGMRPKEAAGGREALAVLKEITAAGGPLPLILLDAHMPGMDGFETAARIKSSPLWSEAVIVILTPAGIRGEAERCRELDVAAYLAKPVKGDLLRRAIAAVLVGNGKEEGDARSLATRTFLEAHRRSLRVLLAEDEPVNRMVALKMLDKMGLRVTAAENGREAVEAFAGGGFDVILMDVQMPEMDGFAATAAIREAEEKKGGHVPIIALTAHAMKGDRERCLAAGMDDYLSKPIRPGELAAILDRLFPKPSLRSPVPLPVE